MMYRIVRLFLIPAFILSISTFSLAKEASIAIADVPPIVIQAVTTKYPGAEVLKAEKETKNGKIEKYELEIRSPDGKKYEVAVSPAGQIVEVEEEND